MLQSLFLLYQEISYDSNSCWDSNLQNYPKKFSITLSVDCLNELNLKRNILPNENPYEFKFLTIFINDLKDTILLNGCGFFVISGKELSNFNKTEVVNIYKIISKIIGELLVQNKEKQTIVEIKDIGLTMNKGGRYHQTKEGGSFHTDGSHLYKNPPDYVGLLCINPAKTGGVSKFISGYKIHEKLSVDESLLKILYEKFHHDKKNENLDSQDLTRFEPIFEIINNQLKFKYQRELIFTGHEKVNQPLTILQIKAIEFLEEILKDPKLVVEYDLKSNDMMFSNNRWLIHDRTPFDDYEDDSLKRLLLRTWIREIN